MGDWIYESPDGGKTVIRRLPLKHDDADKEMELDGGTWMSLDLLRRIGKRNIHEKALRENHPQLMELWESYQTMLKLMDEDKNDEQL